MAVIDWQRNLACARQLTFLFLQVRQPVRVRRMSNLSLRGTTFIRRTRLCGETEVVLELHDFGCAHTGRSHYGCQRSGESAPRRNRTSPAHHRWGGGHWATWGKMLAFTVGFGIINY